jgi:pyruvate,orthophosphate dikinase
MAKVKMNEKIFVCAFGDRSAKSPDLLGIKGAKLAETAQCGIPVPPGFTVTTEACLRYYEDGKVICSEVLAQIKEQIKTVEILSGKTFGGTKNPLLLSVRSYSRQSVPGLMETIVNLGMNNEIAEALSKKTSSPKSAYLSYIQFIKVYSNMVKRFGKKQDAAVLDDYKAEIGIADDEEFSVKNLKELINRYKAAYKADLSEEFPDDPYVQLTNAVATAFHYWDSPRANYYRMVKEIPYSWGAAATVQAMVFGNLGGKKSGSGVAFTRNPSTGKRERLGEFLIDARPGDVLDGTRKPAKLDELREIMPECYDEFVRDCALLEAHYKDMQEISFTIEDGAFYIIKTRKAKRTAAAAFTTACDFVDEGICAEREAILILDPKNIIALRPNKMYDDTENFDGAIATDQNLQELAAMKGYSEPLSEPLVADVQDINEEEESVGGIYNYSQFDYELDDIMSEIYNGYGASVDELSDDTAVTLELKKLIEQRSGITGLDGLPETENEAEQRPERRGKSELALELEKAMAEAEAALAATNEDMSEAELVLEESDIKEDFAQTVALSAEELAMAAEAIAAAEDHLEAAQNEEEVLAAIEEAEAATRSAEIIRETAESRVTAALTEEFTEPGAISPETLDFLEMPELETIEEEPNEAREPIILLEDADEASELLEMIDQVQSKIHKVRVIPVKNKN